MSSSSSQSASASSKADTKPQPSGTWDLCRFAKTLAYFGVIPILSGFGWFQGLFGSSPNPRADQQAIAYGSASSISSPDPQSPPAPSDTSADPVNSNTVISTSSSGETRLIFDFRNPDAPISEIWGAVDDVVMGGVSQSRIVSSSGSALFEGVVSTENSGGFASVRTRNFDPPLDLSDYSGIELRVRGDGKRYKFLLRDESRWDGIGYSLSFDTAANTWITVQAPFAELIPVFRARTLQDGQRIDPSQIRAFQVMLSKFEYDGNLNPTFEPGEFQLHIETIRAYR